MSIELEGKPATPEIEQQVKPKGFQAIPTMRWVSYTSRYTELLEPLEFVSMDGESIIVPAGYQTDYASIPRIFRNIYEPVGPARFPAIVHDFLYGSLGYGPYYKTRKESDDLFLQGMQLVGVDFIQRTTIYNAVRSFGWLYSGVWNRDPIPKAIDI